MLGDNWTVPWLRSGLAVCAPLQDGVQQDEWRARGDSVVPQFEPTQDQVQPTVCELHHCPCALLRFAHADGVRGRNMLSISITWACSHATSNMDGSRRRGRERREVCVISSLSTLFIFMCERRATSPHVRVDLDVQNVLRTGDWAPDPTILCSCIATPLVLYC